MKNKLIYPILLLAPLIFLKCNLEQSQTAQSYLVINATVNKENKKELPEYLAKALQIFDANGGKPIGKYKTLEILMGEGSPEMIGIVAFANDQKIKEMINSEDFENLSELRSKVFEKLDLLLCSEL